MFVSVNYNLSIVEMLYELLENLLGSTRNVDDFHDVPLVLLPDWMVVWVNSLLKNAALWESGFFGIIELPERSGLMWIFERISHI